MARLLGLGNRNEWMAWSKSGARPASMPSSPDQAYTHDGWEGWGRWLGTGNLRTKQFLPFAEALVVARSLGLAGRTEWEAWFKNGMCPPNVPADPRRVYKHDGWEGWGHWLGTGNIKAGTEHFLPLSEALAVAHALGLANQREWEAWSKEGMRPPNVPCRPDQVYTHGERQGWGPPLAGVQQPRHRRQHRAACHRRTRITARVTAQPFSAA